jgi:hypothetical protein
VSTAAAAAAAVASSIVNSSLDNSCSAWRRERERERVKQDFLQQPTTLAKAEDFTPTVTPLDDADAAHAASSK